MWLKRLVKYWAAASIGLDRFRSWKRNHRVGASEHTSSWCFVRNTEEEEAACPITAKQPAAWEVQRITQEDIFAKMTFIYS